MRRMPILFCAALLMAAGCGHKAATEADQQPAQSPVETAVVHAQKVTDTVMLPARVEPDPGRVVHVFSQIAGRLLELKVRPGQEVTKGEVIGTIQSADVTEARAIYQKAKIEADRADRQLDRARALLQHEVLAQRDFDDLQAADQAAHAEVTRTAQHIEMLGFSPEGTSDVAPLRAPISGAVLDIGTAGGEMQRSLDNASAIATLANLDTVWVLGDVFERDLEAVRVGRPAEIHLAAYPGETLHGTISNISDAIDVNTHMFKARIVLPNPHHALKPEMFATINIVRGSVEAMVVPATAVVHEGSGSIVFVQAADGKYEQRGVTTGGIEDKQVIVTSGLKDGERIVTTGAALLRAPAGD